MLAKASNGYDTVIKPSDQLAGYISSKIVDSEQSPHASHYTTFTLKWIAYFIQFACEAYYSFSLMMLVGVMLTLQSFGKDFVERLQVVGAGENQKSIDWGLHMISEVRQLKEKVDVLTSNSILFVYVLTLTNFGQTPSIYLHNTSFSAKLPFYISIVNNSMFWLMASEFHSKVDSAIKKWVYCYQNESWVTSTDRMRLLMAGNEIEAMPIGLSCQFFTTTFDFVGSMLGLIITYAIIIFQLHTGANRT
ncbi:unnamed protein product [Orchesella dallaii]|uniref:Uncharacterized protein n=1 Tax=Orchesella dallaii TaxID=48710 RepID=A0ABP1Q9M3_9HEXA